MKTFLYSLLLSGFLLSPSLLFSQELAELNEKLTEVEYAMDAQTKEVLLKESEAIDKKYAKIVKKSKRWNKQLSKSILRSLRDLKLYESQTLLWAQQISEEHPDLELNQETALAEESFDSELNAYLTDLKNYSALLNSKWKASESPAVGLRINEARNGVERLSSLRNEILSDNELGGINDIQEINNRIDMTCASIIAMYKDAKSGSSEASQIFEVLQMANEIVPVYQEYISKALLKMGKTEVERDQFNRQMAALVLNMSDEYLSSIYIVKDAKLKSLEIFESEDTEQVPDQILKFKASLKDVETLNSLAFMY